ncbi:conserved hypothetical protein [Arthrobacter sp. 9V]|uniref:hypothetical protein n=1 Tax=Arthrobacter sp. 9V TaxID=2653132 RepID=UPI0012F36220|nr:hypothetical protein [Arthrobacter sp. 9V]VXC13975.1 conserved hypothetical protein [Arthrobacter sp. 9V]
MSYDFHLICDEDPREGRFAYACGEFENKFFVNAVEGSENLVVNLAGEDLGLISVPLNVPNSEVGRVFGEEVAHQLAGDAWVSEVNCPYDKDTAEAVRAFLMITVIGTKGLLIDPQSNEVINAEWGA